MHNKISGNVAHIFTGIFLLIILHTSSSILLAQNSSISNYSKQITVHTDNDRYLLQNKDGYYTNGLAIKYTVASKSKNDRLDKKLNEVEIGQLLFTQGRRRIYGAAEIDRPITGYLYAKFNQTLFFNSKSFWNWGASMGTIGKSSLGENLQDFFHKAITVNSSFWGWIWDYQLKDEIGVNVHGSYAVALLPNKGTSFIQLTPEVNATAGTSFTNIKMGTVLQIGKLSSISESNYFNASVSKTAGSKTETYLYYHPQLTAQVYNATIQGGMFREDKGPFTAAIYPVVMQHQLGAAFSKSKYAISMHVTKQTKEAKSQRASHAYGRLQLSFRFN